MIALVEGASRQKTPNEIALNILLASLTIVFLLAVVTLQPFAIYSGAEQSLDRARRAAGLPDPDHDRRAAVGHRHRRAWTGWCSATCWRCPAARSRRPATSTRCCSTRPAPSPSATGRPPSSCPVARRRRRRARRRRPARPAWPTRRPEGRSIVVLAKTEYGLRERAPGELGRRDFVAVHRPDPDERRRPRRRRGRSARAPPAAVIEVGPRQRRRTPPRTSARIVDGISTARRHAAGRRRARRRRRRPGARRHPPQGRRQGGHARAVRRDAPRWASAR